MTFSPSKDTPKRMVIAPTQLTIECIISKVIIYYFIKFIIIFYYLAKGDYYLPILPK